MSARPSIKDAAQYDALRDTTITRNGSAEDPALELRQDGGQRILKLQSEVERANE